MSRGYGNAARWERQAQAIGATAARVAAASNAAAAQEAVDAVQTNLGTGYDVGAGTLQEKIADLENRLAALEP